MVKTYEGRRESGYKFIHSLPASIVIVLQAFGWVLPLLTVAFYSSSANLSPPRLLDELDVREVVVQDTRQVLQALALLVQEL